MNRPAPFTKLVYSGILAVLAVAPHASWADEGLGACCRRFGQCLTLTAEGCASVTDGTFIGEGTSCTPDTCRGACCRPNADCDEPLTQGQCEGSGGSYSGHGTVCGSVICPLLPNGACCFGFGCDDAVTSEFCTGTYLGDGTACGECPGACCQSDGSCTDSTAQACVDSTSIFHSLSACPPGGCGDGACCLPTLDQSGSCFGPIDPFNCVFSGGLHGGAGSTCGVDTCSSFGGACCFQTGGCVITGEEYCADVIVANFIGEGVACAIDDGCPGPAACCIDGVCLAHDGQACSAAGGEYLGEGTSCSIEFCGTGLPNGSSCVTNMACNGTCIGNVCNNPSGVGGPCDPLDNNDCNGQAVCDEGDDVCRLPNGQGCAANEACTGTCIDGVCQDESGVGEICDSLDNDDCDGVAVCDGVDDICRLPNDESCTGNGDCVGTCLDGVCEDASGVGEICDSLDNDDCDGVAVCDGVDDTCRLPNDESCTGNGDCVGTCLDGVCEDAAGIGEVCDTLDDSDCVDLAVCDFTDDTCRWPNGNQCTSNSDCLNTCISNMCSDVGDSGDSCDALDNDDCMGSTVCINEACTPAVTGACCGTVGCHVLTEVECDGVYQGDNTACGPANQCPQGACCAADSCVLTSPIECLQPAAYQGDGSTCEGTCPGACCVLASGCSSESQASCTAAGGQFLGIGASCPSSSECCVFDIDCDDGLACTIDTCDAVIGCLNGADSASCDDDIGCTNDLCQPLNESADEEGCVFMPNHAACDEPNACTVDICDPTSGCTTESETDCPPDEDGNDCTERNCNPASGACESVNVCGACCVRNSGCIDGVSEPACFDDGGDFMGVASVCSDEPCGACCAENHSGCGDHWSPAACDEAGYVSAGAGSTCLSDPCVGACCQADGTCSVTPGESCLGDFRGTGSGCDEVTCAAFTSGACCVTLGCLDGTTAVTCTRSHFGLYQGEGTTCAVIDCLSEESGACCDEWGRCGETTETSCAGYSEQTGLAVTFLGVGSECDTSSQGYRVCPANGACCQPGGGCTIATGDACDLTLGEYQGDGTACDELDPGCASQTGACCVFDQGCTDGLLQIQCHDIADGFFLGAGTTCATAGCGACCTANQGCVDGATAIDCDDSADAYFPGMTCAAVPCGACCEVFASGCGDGWTEAPCAGAGFIFQGPGSNCEADPCMGVCCSADGSCSVTSAAACAGDFRGNGTGCDEVTCTLFTGGACCTNGTCMDGTTPNTCFNTLSGSYQGVGSTCATVDCAATGACCYEFGCYHDTAAGCHAYGQNIGSSTMFFGVGSECDGFDFNECPGHGACCLGDGSCVVTTFGSCLNMDAAFYHGDGTSCDEIPEACDPVVGACCKPDGTCQDGVVRRTCEDAVQGQFAGVGSSCSTTTCGACCYRNSGCFDYTPSSQCPGPFGAHFESTTCAEAPCGACCAQMDSACGDGWTESMCTNEGYVFQGVHTTCAANPCAGACCSTDGGCAVTESLACIGDFQGNGTACDEAMCDEFAGGACCLHSGICVEGVSAATCFDTLFGNFQGTGVTCLPELCTTIGACCTANGCANWTVGGCDNYAQTSGIPTAYLGDNSMCVVSDDGFLACPEDGVCTPDLAGDCDDGDPCTEDRCDPIQGCANPPRECPVGMRCDEAGACACPRMCGDLDHDGDRDDDDLLVIRHLIGTTSEDSGYNACADYDRDKVITRFDAEAWLHLCTPMPFNPVGP